VVFDNLRLTLPDKSESELLKIRKDFYHHMCDLFLEMIKSLNLGPAAVKKRFHVVNIDLLKELEQTRSILIMSSHYANWEWSVSMNNYVSSKGYCIYQKVRNPYFNKLINRMRSQWNTIPLSQAESIKTIIKNEKENVRGIYGIVSDQSPMPSKANYWQEFMGVKVPVHTGAEMLARKLDLTVLYQNITKVKRGYYQSELIPIAVSGSETSKHQITNRFIELTEAQINEEPAHYLWTHKRWKHRNKVPEAFQ
jgi:KDO2-lipid IV(A) lauroyltransferase